jgi:hypothetical protein
MCYCRHCDNACHVLLLSLRQCHHVLCLACAVVVTATMPSCAVPGMCCCCHCDNAAHHQLALSHIVKCTVPRTSLLSSLSLSSLSTFLALTHPLPFWRSLPPTVGRIAPHQEGKSGSSPGRLHACLTTAAGCVRPCLEQRPRFGTACIKTFVGA